MRPSSTLLSISLSAILVALVAPWGHGQIIDPETPPKAKITWEGSVAAGLAKAKAAKKPILWVVMIEREVACRRMMRRVWKDQTVLAKAQGFVLIPCNPYPEEDLTLFPGVTARQVKANEAAFRTRYETRTEIIAPQHLITDAAGKLIVRKDYELDAKGLNALMDRALKKFGKSGAGVAAGDPASGKPVVAKSTEEIEADEGESEADEPAEEEPTEEAKRLVNLIIRAPSDEKEDLTDELLKIANLADVKVLTKAVFDRKIRSDKDAAAVVRRGGYDRNADKAKAFLTLLAAKSSKVRNAAVVTLEELKSSVAAKPLMERFKKEKDPEVKKDILRALGPAGVGDQGARDLILKYAKKRSKLGLNALMALGPHLTGDPEVRKALKDAWKKTNKNHHLAILYSYWVAQDPETIDDLKWIKKREKRGTEHDLAETILAGLEDRQPERGNGGRGRGRGGRGGLGNLGGQWRILMAWRPLFEQDKVQRNAVKDIRDGFGGFGRGR